MPSRLLLALFLIPLLPALAGALAPVAAQAAGDHDPRTVDEDERILGDADAPVTVIEYASLTCPHCASFHRDVLPELKERYIEPGHVRLVYRDFPLDRVAAAAGLLARCVEPADRSLDAVDRLYEQHEQWMMAEKPLMAVVELLEPFGLDQERAEVCLADEDALNRMVEIAQAGHDTFEIPGTPAFAIEGERVADLHSIEDFARVIDPLLAD